MARRKRVGDITRFEKEWDDAERMTRPDMSVPPCSDQPQKQRRQKNEWKGNSRPFELSYEAWLIWRIAALAGAPFPGVGLLSG